MSNEREVWSFPLELLSPRLRCDIYHGSGQFIETRAPICDHADNGRQAALHISCPCGRPSCDHCGKEPHARRDVQGTVRARFRHIKNSTIRALGRYLDLRRTRIENSHVTKISTEANHYGEALFRIIKFLGRHRQGHHAQQGGGEKSGSLIACGTACGEAGPH